MFDELVFHHLLSRVTFLDRINLRSKMIALNSSFHLVSRISIKISDQFDRLIDLNNVANQKFVDHQTESNQIKSSDGIQRTQSIITFSKRSNETILGEE